MRNQLSFVEERVRGELLRRAVPVLDHPGAVGLLSGPAEGAPPRRAPRPVSELMAGPFHDLDGLVEWLVAELDAEDGAGGAWTGRAASGTVSAFVRRLESAAGRLRGLVRSDASPIPRGDAAEDEPPVAVVHLARLHDFAQRFVVGTLLAQTFGAKEVGTRDPIEFVVLDELNKYAPREGDSPIKETLIDIAQRGRSLGVILVGRPAAGVAGGLGDHPERRDPDRRPAGRRRGRAQRVRLARPRRPRPGAPADAGARAGQPAERPGADRRGDPLPALGHDLRRGLDGRPRRRRDRGVRLKLLHTSDWHLGKRLFGVERMDEAEAALAEIAEAAEREAVDARHRVRRPAGPRA